MIDIGGQDAIALTFKLLPRLQLTHLHLEGEGVVGDLEVVLDAFALTLGAVDFELSLPVRQRHRLNESREAEEVVAMKVGYKDGVEL